MSDPVETPDQKYLLDLLRYDEHSGLLFWKYRPVNLFKTKAAHGMWNKRFAGKVAFDSERNGYKRGAIDYRRYTAHRIIWKMVHGIDPEYIDHINANRGDNRLVNLRNVSHAENCKNSSIKSTSKTGVNGVHWESSAGKWRARIRVAVSGKAKQLNLGLFNTIAEAAEARAAADIFYGFHELHGKHSTSHAKPTNHIKQP